MALSLGFRPRGAEELQALAQGLLDKGPVRGSVDPWTAAQMWVAGRLDERPQALARLGTCPRRAVSVLICTWNRLPQLKKAVASVRAQDWPVQLVVVDDGSDDGTAEWLEQQSDILAVIQQNTGKPGALAAGLQKVEGEAVLVLDDDDLLMPRALEVLAPALFANDLVGVFGDAVRFGLKTEYVRCPRLSPQTTRRAVLAQVPGLTGALLARTDAIRELGFDPRLSRGEDMDFFLRLCRFGPVDQVPLATLKVRSWDGVRGGPGQTWRRNDTAYQDEVKRLVGPIFRERWQELAEDDRSEGHAWALGLLERGMRSDAHTELKRWKAPYSEFEAWVRQRAGLKSKQASSGHLLVVDDGDAGALAATLERQRPGRSLHISLEVPQQPETQLWWAGEYAVRSRLDQLSTGPWDVRLASSPEWAPPTAPIPPLPLTAADGLVVVAVVRGWPLPSLERRAIGLGREARLALAWSRETRAPQKLALLAELLERFPTWEELFSLAQASLRGVD